MSADDYDRSRGQTFLGYVLGREGISQRYAGQDLPHDDLLRSNAAAGCKDAPAADRLAPGGAATLALRVTTGDRSPPPSPTGASFLTS